MEATLLEVVAKMRIKVLVSWVILILLTTKYGQNAACELPCRPWRW